MKIRGDFVSNSSSSSFVLFGNMHEGAKISIDDWSSMDAVKNGRPEKLTIEDFADLGRNEAFFTILPNSGSEGDYIIKFTPELLMDCHIHQIDLYKFNIIRAKYFMTEGGYVYPATKFNSGDDWMDEDDQLRTQVRGSGLDVSGLRVFRYSKDYGNPTERSEILDAMERHAKYS